MQPLVKGIDLSAESSEFTGAGLDEPQLVAHSGHVEYAIFGEYGSPALSVAGIPGARIFSLEIHYREPCFSLFETRFKGR
ncbi:hypothetical protein D9M70_598720 [compost metagenome]